VHDHHDHHHHQDYEASVDDGRAAKDAFFRSSPHSPIGSSERAGFKGLAYYPLDRALRFEDLKLEPLPYGDARELEIATSDGGYRTASRLGRLTFTIDGQSRALAAYHLGGAADGSLFVPFLDATSGEETYGAGRYLDIDPEPDGSYVLDFNAAYHPFCVYSPEYSCPLTPTENRLPDRIEAGERLPIAAAP
jgi:uncharacterized protein (DUF1684 family)